MYRTRFTRYTFIY